MSPTLSCYKAGVTISIHYLIIFIIIIVQVGSSVGNESACNAGDPGLIPGSGRSPGEGIGYPLQYSWASLVAQMVKNLPVMWKTWVWSLGWEDPLKKGTLSTPVFWPGEFRGQRSLAGYSPWNCKELDMTEQLSLHFHSIGWGPTIGIFTFIHLSDSFQRLCSEYRATLI